VESLFRLFDEVLEHEPERLNSRNIRIVISGMVGLLPAPLPRKFEQAVELTADNTGLVLNLCVMYSGRSEIIEAAKLAAADIAAGKLEPDALDERRFSRYLYQPGLPDVDLVVRTSGEVRISNFLLWQMAYAELVFTDVLWPDFTRRDFMLALDTYQQRVRRFGRV
jgi:undecaprenyl diphosphate synthase